MRPDLEKLRSNTDIQPSLSGGSASRLPITAVISFACRLVRACAVVFFLVCFVYCSHPAFAEHPFKPDDHKDEVRSCRVTEQLMMKIGRVQAELKQRLTRLTRQFKDQYSSRVLFVLFSLAFAYGMLHSIGPGHGKAVVLAFVLSREISLTSAVLLGAGAAFFHGISAIAVVLGISFVSTGGFHSAFQNASSHMVIMSYSLIILIGVVLFITRVREVLRHNSHDARQKKSSATVMALSLGLVPCPGVMIVLLFFLAQHMLALGIATGMFISLGMALTVSLIGLAGAVAHRGLASREASPFARTIQGILEIGASLAIILLGTLFLFSALQ